MTGNPGSGQRPARQELSPEAIRRGLSTRVVGRQVRYEASIGSTNTELKRLADAGAPEGLLLVTDEQTAGRGRFERSWYAPAGSCLLTSLLFRPTFLPPQRSQQLTMICALAAVEAVAAETGLAVGIKWPNDLVYEGRKLAGLLTESSFSGATLDWVVVGLGLNVNLDFAASAEPGLAGTATSLQMILGRPVSRPALLRGYLTWVDRYYETLRGGWSPQAAWAERLVTLGREVVVSNGEQVIEGLAEAVDEDGALLVRRPDGGLERCLAGDVTLKPKP